LVELKKALFAYPVFLTIGFFAVLYSILYFSGNDIFEIPLIFHIVVWILIYIGMVAGMIRIYGK